MDIPTDISQDEIPTPAEIRQACTGIQKSWSEAERRRRGAWMIDQQRVQVPVGIDRDDGFTIRTTEGEFLIA